MSDFENMSASEKSCFGSFYSVETTKFPFLFYLKKHDFDLTILLHVRFEFEENTTR